MSLRSCGNRSRTVSHRYNLPGVLDLFVLAAIAARIMAPTCMRETPVIPHGDAPRQGSLVMPYGNVPFGQTRLTSHS